MNKLFPAIIAAAGVMSCQVNINPTNSNNFYQYSVLNTNVESSSVNLVYDNEIISDLYVNIKKLLLIIKEYDNFDEDFNKLVNNSDFCFIFEAVMNEFDEEKRISILSDFLDTNINIFTTWYVKELFKCLKSEKQYIKLKAQSFYELYKNSFDKFVC